MTELERFVAESNAIENINRDPTNEEVHAHRKLLRLKRVRIVDMMDFVGVVQPDARLRDRAGLNCYVGTHRPPPGGPKVPKLLEPILLRAEEGRHNVDEAYRVHVDYETLHPFMDGNGRSGRALLLWQMGGYGLGGLTFLRWWYYASLRNAPQRASVK